MSDRLTAAQLAEIEARAVACNGHGIMARGLIKTDIPALLRDLRAAREALLAAERDCFKFRCERDEARAESARLRAWQPAATAPHDHVCDFWLEWADDVKNEPPLGQSRWSFDQQFRGKRGCWGSVYKATYWRHLPAPPAELTTPAPASDGMRKGEVRAGVARLQAKLDAEPGLFVRPDFIWGGKK